MIRTYDRRNSFGMKLFSIDKINDFKCIGGKCPDTCCRGWDKILIDPKAYAYYQSIEGALGDELRKHIFSKESEYPYLAMNEKGYCHF